jgi:SAM-dependent methyltransferase
LCLAAEPIGFDEPLARGAFGLGRPLVRFGSLASGGCDLLFRCGALLLGQCGVLARLVQMVLRTSLLAMRACPPLQRNRYRESDNHDHDDHHDEPGGHVDLQVPANSGLTRCLHRPNDGFTGRGDADRGTRAAPSRLPLSKIRSKISKRRREGEHNGGVSETRPRWFTEHDGEHSQWYIDRFRAMAAEGKDLAGEARFLDALVAPRSRILDAGCGTGRLSKALHDRGHTVVGVDVDPALIDAAAHDYPGPRYVVADLATLELDEEPFDAALLAGNVLVFVAPGSEVDVLRRVGAHLKPDGVVASGFATDRDYTVDAYDLDIVTAGLVLEQRFATWDLRPWQPETSWAVSVLRRPAT